MPELRPVSVNDLPTLVQHRRRMWVEIIRTEPRFAGIGTGALDAADVRYARWLREKLAAEELVGFVVEEPPGSPVASGCLWLREEVPRPTRPQTRMPYILSVYTEEDRRRRGHARSITEALLGWARERGYPRVRLNASVLGEPLYRSMGFEVSSERQIDLVPLERHDPSPAPP